MNIDSCFQLGYVIKPHGLKGDVSIYIDADNPQNYKNLESVFIRQGNQLVPFFISCINISGNKAILSLDESNDIDMARSLKGATLHLPLNLLPELTENQFYFHEIIGFMAVDQTLGEIGPVKLVYDAGPQDLLAIEYKGVEVLLPINDVTVGKVNRNKKQVFVNIPDGLIDIYLSNDENED
jgi:16S rRNA processing protein RimM